MAKKRSSLLIEAGESLRGILRDGLHDGSEARTRVVDGLPSRDLRERLLPFISVHLYRVEEDRTLFDPRRVLVGDGEGGSADPAVYAGPPVYLSLQYAVIPWGRDPLEQSRLIEQSITALMDATRRPAARPGPDTGGEPAAMDPGHLRLRFTQPFDLSDQTRVLNSLGLALRPLISCSMTACLRPTERFRVPRVRSRRLRIEEALPAATAAANGPARPRPAGGGSHGA